MHKRWLSVNTVPSGFTKQNWVSDESMNLIGEHIIINYFTVALLNASRSCCFCSALQKEKNLCIESGSANAGALPKPLTLPPADSFCPFECILKSLMMGNGEWEGFLPFRALFVATFPLQYQSWLKLQQVDKSLIYLQQLLTFLSFLRRTFSITRFICSPL